MEEKMSYEEFRLGVVREIIEHCKLEDNPDRVFLLADGFTSDDPEMRKTIDATNQKYGHGESKYLVGDFVFLKVHKPGMRRAECRFELIYLYDQYVIGGWERVYTIVDKNIEAAIAADISVFSTVSDYEATREKLLLCLRNCSDYRVKYGEYVHQRMDDMVILLYVIMNDDGEGNRMISPLRRSVLEGWGKSEDDVFAVALKNTARLSPPRLYMGFEAFLGGEDTEKCDFMNPLKPLKKIPNNPFGAFVTAVPGSDGAVAIFYPGVQERIAEMAGGDYYVVFIGKSGAQIHPSKTVKLEDLREMLWDSNHQFPKDMLTSNVYFYDTKKKKLRKA